MAGIETVYLLGAGFNQCVKDWHGLKPPMARNFFQTLLQSKQSESPHYSRGVDCVFEYIERYWKKSREDLLKEPFDLEECLTFLELQRTEVDKAGNQADLEKLTRVSFGLKTLVCKFLSEFVVDRFAFFEKTRGKVEDARSLLQPDLLTLFGQRVYWEKPIVITFNYDCFVEDAIASASGPPRTIPEDLMTVVGEGGQVPDQYLSYAFLGWNIPLAYGFKFDEVTLQITGPGLVVEGSRFYEHAENSLYDWRILKLHGSLNWFEYAEPMVANPEERFPDLLAHKQGDVLLKRSFFHMQMPPMEESWFLHPLVITPGLYKDAYYARRPFRELWSQAKSYLSKCSRLIVIGYSFPATDFHVRKLLLEAFVDNNLEQLIVVNPDTAVVQTVKELVHFGKPVTVAYDIGEFLTM